MSHYQIRRNLSREVLRASVPHSFRAVCDLSRLRGDKFSLIVFPSEAVVASALVEKALAEITDDSAEDIVALGNNFTQEGFEALERRHAIAFVLRGSFHWSDESARKDA